MGCPEKTEPICWPTPSPLNCRVVSVSHSSSGGPLLAVSEFGRISEPSVVFTCRLKDTTEGRHAVDPIATITSHQGPIRGLAVHQNRVISGDDSTHVLVSGCETGNLIHQLPDPPFFTWRIASFPRCWNDDVFVAGFRGTLFRYSLATGEKRTFFDGHCRRFSVVGIGADEQRRILFSGSDNGELYFWSTTDPNERVASIETCPNVSSVLYDEKNDKILVGSENGSIEVWDPRNLEEYVNILNVHGQPGPVNQIIRVSESSFASVASDVSVWEETALNSAQTVMRTEGVCFGCCLVNFENHLHSQ